MLRLKLHTYSLNVLNLVYVDQDWRLQWEDPNIECRNEIKVRQRAACDLWTKGKDYELE